MRILIVEDETAACENLWVILKEIEPEINIAGCTESIAQTVRWLKNNELPDLILMDIHLSDGSAFSVFDKLNIETPVIFTTAYDEYALQAFKVYGAAYLLKPIVQEELEDALNKIKRIKPKFSGNDVETLMDMFRTQQKKYKTRFLLHFRETYKVIPVEEIDYAFLEHKTVYFRLIDGSTIAVPYNLEELEEQLDPQFFFRVNRQYILHVNSIESMHKYFNEKTKIVLKRDRDAEVIVSRIKMPQFKMWLDR